MPTRESTPVLFAVVVVLGLALLACLGGSVWLAATGHEVPDFLAVTGGATVGALGALLVPTGGET